MTHWLNAAILLLASAIGAVAFVAPFFSLETALPGDGGALSHAADAPFFLILLIVICLGAVLLNLSAGQMNTRTVAVLGILTAFNAVLRALPGPGGFNAIFFLPILAGHVYGATFGFLLGSLSLLVSALLGGGVGPWLPFQMFATGWVGMLGALAPKTVEGTTRGNTTAAPSAAAQLAKSHQPQRLFAPFHEAISCPASSTACATCTRLCASTPIVITSASPTATVRAAPGLTWLSSVSNRLLSS